MFGYLTEDDQDFLDRITDELNNFNSSEDRSFILLFPPLPSRFRLILHRLRESKYPLLFSFSVGEEKQSRQTIIGWKSQVMDELLLSESSNIDQTTEKAATSSEVSSGNRTTPTKRRPDKALYQPPRRSQGVESIAETIPTVISSNDESPKTKEQKQTTKPKSSRPSAEPYVPPSRRSQTSNQENVAMTQTVTTAVSSNVNETPVKIAEVKQEQTPNDDEEEEWEKLADKSDDSFNKELVEEIQKKFKEVVQIRKPTQNYSEWTVQDLQTKEMDFAHVVEVSNFPSTTRTEDIHMAFSSFARRGFEIKWVDDTHALIVFADAETALDVLRIFHPMFKVSPMSEACAASKKKAKSSIEFLQPYRARPETTSLAANRRICAVLGLKNPMSSEKAKSEREKLESARSQKKREKEEKNQIWECKTFPSSSNQ